MVSGMDTSAVDVFQEIIDLCRDNHCRLFLAGLSDDLRSEMSYTGIKPGTGSYSFSYATDLESALARAEDGLLSNKYHLEDKAEQETSTRKRARSEGNVEDGFLYALKRIDEQHNLNTAVELRDLREYTTPIGLDPHDLLFHDMSADDGLCFVETGLLHIRHRGGSTATRGMSFSDATLRDAPTPSLYDPLCRSVI